MPRGQLPKLKPSIVLDRHLFRVDQLPPSLSSPSLFQNERPWELEIGSGKGLFLQKAAARRPEHNFVGVEIAKMYAAHAASRLVNDQLGNAIMVEGDAQQLYSRIPDGSLADVHVYFPDPWWKKRHKKRRVVNEHSVKEFYRMLSPRGTFHFWTDVLEYFESAVEMIAETLPAFGPPLPEDADEESIDGQSQSIDYRTHFERRSVLHEIPVYRVCFHKPAAV